MTRQELRASQSECQFESSSVETSTITRFSSCNPKTEVPPYRSTGHLFASTIDTVSGPQPSPPEVAGGSGYCSEGCLASLSRRRSRPGYGRSVHPRNCQHDCALEPTKRKVDRRRGTHASRPNCCCIGDCCWLRDPGAQLGCRPC